MPWARLDESAMDHPKVSALADGAFRLWVQGLVYCQRFLTDGYISDVALRGQRAYSPKRKAELLTVGLWEASETGVRVHDYLDWNESREHVMAARHHARNRMRKKRESFARTRDERSANVPSGWVGDVSESSEVKERGAGKTMTLPERAGAFTEWYEDTHERLFGVGYMGTNNDWQKALEMCAKFTDSQMRDGAMVCSGPMTTSPRRARARS